MFFFPTEAARTLVTNDISISKRKFAVSLNVRGVFLAFTEFAYFPSGEPKFYLVEVQLYWLSVYRGAN
jgi:hypothetical protein